MFKKNALDIERSISVPNTLFPGSYNLRNVFLIVAVYEVMKGGTP